MTKYLLLLDSYNLVSVGRPLWREDGSVFYICCWPLPAQSFSDPSPLGLATIFYCVRFETSFFVASYDSQGHGGGIRPRLYTGNCQSYLFFITTLHGPRRKHPACCWEGVFTALLHSSGSYSIVACVFVVVGMCLPIHYLAMDVFSDFTVPAFGRHVAICRYVSLMSSNW
jgi:hypothetical protein